MTSTVPREADWLEAPSLLEGASRLELTPQDCHLDYWFSAVAQGTLAGMVHGHSPFARVPSYMLEPGGLRDAIMSEFAFRAIAEEKATRAIAHIASNAPDIFTMEFYTTQMVDEARHSRVFRGHLMELGVAETDLAATIQAIAANDAHLILEPLEAFALPMLRDQRDFIAGAVILTIIVEGVLAPAAELSERKWRILDPAAAEIERCAGIDEIRHLTVGASVVKQYLQQHPHERQRILEIIMLGRHLWTTLPTADVIIKREMHFQRGLEEHRDVAGDYELWPGKRLIDTTPEDRLGAAHEWSMTMQNNRLQYMGLPEAIP
jgi:hypothetical protein